MSWDDEVLKTRAQIFARENPTPPMSTGTKIVVIVLSILALGVCGAAWAVLLRIPIW